MTLVVTLVPHAGKKMFVLRGINVRHFASVLLVFAVRFYVGVRYLAVHDLGSKILAI